MKESVLALVTLVVISVLSNNAYANDVILADQASCESISGSWDSETNTCNVLNLTINNGDTLTIASGVTLSIGNSLHNNGILTNTGILVITSSAEFANTGHFENLGGFQNFGAVFINGSMDNEITGTISNNGTIEINGTGLLNNFGTVITPGVINIDGNSVLDNLNFIELGAGEIDIGPYSILINQDTIQFCNGIIIGMITGNQPIDTCPNNDPPIISPIESLQANEGLPFIFGVTASDPDFGQILTFNLIGEPTGMIINSVTGMITWFPDETQGGTSYTFDIVVTDNGIPPLSSTETTTIVVNDINSSPTLDPVSPLSPINEGDTVSFTATASDPDIPAQILTFNLAGAPLDATIDPVTGVFSWTPSETQQGTHIFDVMVTDNGSPPLADSETITITVNEVNQPPILASIGPQTASEGIEFSFAASATDSDLPVQPLTFSLVNAPLGASITNGVFSWTPSESDGGQTFNNIEIHVFDGFADVFTTFSVAVTETNSPPSLALIGLKTVDENTELAFDVSGIDADLPPQTLAYSISGAPPGASITSAGHFSWTPSETQGPNTYTLDVIVTDSGTPPQSISETITITVNEVNQPPILASIGPQTAIEGIEFSFAASATDSDLPVQPLTFSLVNAPLGASITNGVFSWTPSESDGGQTFNNIEIHVFDGFADVFTTFSVAVTETNSPPVIATIPILTASKNNLFEYQIIASDTDIPTQTLTYNLVGATPIGLTISPTGLLSWIPNQLQVGSQTVNVQVSDGIVSVSKPITIVVNDSNTSPILGPLTVLSPVFEGNLVTFTATATDPDLPPQALTFSLGFGAPTGATIDPRTGVFKWIPSELQGDGIYTFNVIATDNGLPPMSDSQPVTISVNEANSPPFITPIPPQIASVGTLFMYQVVATDSDIPTQTLSYSLTTGAPAGLVINPTLGLITFTGTQSQVGTYTFNVMVTDNGAPSATSVVSVKLSVQELFCGLPESAFSHVIRGTNGNDNLKGTNDNDLILGLGGNDSIEGLKGNDCIYGGDGDDKIKGNNGNDTVYGGNGNDKIEGNDGNDLLYGENGKDNIKGGDGNDYIDGGNNTDKCDGGSGKDTLLSCEIRDDDHDGRKK